MFFILGIFYECFTLSISFVIFKKIRDTTMSSSVTLDEDHDSVSEDSDNDYRETNKENIENKRTRRRHSTPWKVDEAIHPIGWKHKRVRKENKDFMLYLLPNGKLLKGRIAALQFMEKRKLPMLDIKKIMRTLPEEGWKSDVLLPEDWFYKKAKNLETYRVNFYTNKGIFLKGKERAHRMIVANTYSENGKVLENFLTFCGSKYNKQKQDKTSELKSVRDSWTSDESIYPKGWKYKKESGGFKIRL